MIDIESILNNPDRLRMEKGLLTCVDEEFAARLRRFLERYEKIRRDETASLRPITDYPALPFGEHHEHRFEWVLRRASLRAVWKLMRERVAQDVLEISPWNGWLSNRLAGMGHHLLAVDYFSDETDGLRASRHYPNTWLTMQTDIEHLDFRERSFDVVIVNHALQFVTDPVDYVERLKSLVKEGGLLILIGLSFYNDPSVKGESVAAFRQRHLDRHDFDIFFVPTKGYLDGNDRQALIERDVELHLYSEPALLARSLRAYLVPARPTYGYGVWKW